MAVNHEMLKEARDERGWTQATLAARLGVSQGYVALLESGRRQPSDALRRRLARVLQLPATSLPTTVGRATADVDALVAELADLGYPGFSHLRRGRPRRNPGALLLDALAAEALDPRTAEALPWLLLTFPDLDWDWLLPQVKQRDLQNRLGYVVSLARNVAHLQGLDVTRVLEEREALLERSRLVREDVFGRSSLTDAERRWLRSNRPPEAAHWNILSDLRPESLVHGG
jgi:transcriptional regulator with XRE-family HTH domain